MRDWRRLLRSDPIPWLMKSEDPSLRYLLLIELLDRPSGDRDVQAAKAELGTTGLAGRILASQGEGGHWGREEEFYQRSKYKGTVWNAIILAELGVDRSDLRVARLAEFLMQWPRRQDGGFTYKGGPGQEHKPALPCLTANMVHALCRFDTADDPRLDRSIGLLVEPLKGEVYQGSQGKCARCRSGKVKMLKALNALSPERRSRDMEARRRCLSEEILDTCLPRSIDELAPSRPEWAKLSFPHMWDTDLVEMLDVLSALGRWDERMRPALEIVLGKQDSAGRWALEGGWNGRMLVRFDQVGRPSPWVTLKVLTMLKRLPEPGQSL